MADPANSEVVEVIAASISVVLDKRVTSASVVNTICVGPVFG